MRPTKKKKNERKGPPRRQHVQHDSIASRSRILYTCLPRLDSLYVRVATASRTLVCALDLRERERNPQLQSHILRRCNCQILLYLIRVCDVIIYLLKNKKIKFYLQEQKKKRNLIHRIKSSLYNWIKKKLQRDERD